LLEFRSHEPLVRRSSTRGGVWDSSTYLLLLKSLVADCLIYAGRFFSCSRRHFYTTIDRSISGCILSLVIYARSLGLMSREVRSLELRSLGLDRSLVSRKLSSICRRLCESPLELREKLRSLTKGALCISGERVGTLLLRSNRPSRQSRERLA